MLKILAKQTMIYGVSTIIVRFLSYLMTPYFTRIFSQETYGIITDVYALIPLALTLLTMGMESSYFRFSAKAEQSGGDVVAAKRRLFATTWGATIYAALLFFIAIIFFRTSISEWMGASYVSHPEYILWVGGIILVDVWLSVPFSRLREQGRSMTFVGLKALNAALNVGFAVGFGLAGFYDTYFGVGWVLIANFASSSIIFVLILLVTDRVFPKIDWRILSVVLLYSLPLLIGGVTGTANEFIDRQMIKHLVPESALSQLGIYGAVTKIAVIMMLLYQMYRLAAEPFFLSNFKKSDFVEMNAAALKYYVMVSMAIFLAIALFRDGFAYIIGSEFREGIYILPIVLGANMLTGVWLNLSFWYKREGRTVFSIVITVSGLITILLLGSYLIPLFGYYGASWARFGSESVMVVVSIWLSNRYYPVPYDWRRIGEYVAVGLIIFFISEFMSPYIDNKLLYYTFNLLVFISYLIYIVRRERIDVVALVGSILKK